MSSKRRSYDTDEITLRRVFAKNPDNNTNIAGMRVLTADGQGGTYWAQPSTLGLNPSFNQINTTAGNFTADLSYNIFTLTQGPNMGFSKGSGSNELVLFGKAFSILNVQSNNTLYAFSNNTLTSNLTFVGTGGLNITSDPVTNTVSFDVQGNQVSTSQFTFQKAKVLSNTSTVTSDISSLNNFLILNSASPSSILTFVGLGEVSLQSDNLNNAIYIGLNVSTGTTSSLMALVDSISTNYTKLTDFSTACQSLSTISGSNFSSGTSTSYGITSNLSITVFNLPFNLYTTTAQFNNFQSRAETGISSLSTNYTPLTAFYSTTNRLADLFSTINNVSSVSTLNIFGANNVSVDSASVVNVFDSDVSTLSTNVGLSIENLSSFLTFEIQNVSTIAGSNYSSQNVFLQSSILGTIDSLGSYGYVSSLTLDFSLASTVENLGGLGYISSLQPLFSTVENLGIAGYLSSQQLISSVEGLGIAGYLSSQQLTSTVAGLGMAGYISSAQLQSTVLGLGGTGIISTGQLTSTVQGLAIAGYLSSVPFSFSNRFIQTSSIVSVSSLTLFDNSTVPAAQYNFTMSNSSIYANNEKVLSVRPSFFSSLFYSGNNRATFGKQYRTSIDMFLNPTSPDSFYFSSLTLDFINNQTIYPYITSQTKVFLDYSFNFFLDSYRFNDVLNPLSNSNVGNIILFSTLINYGNTPDFSGTINDSFVANSLYSNQDLATAVALSNTVSRRYMFELKPNLFVDNNLANWKKVSVLHVMNQAIYTTAGFSGGYWAGLSTANVLLNQGSTNIVFVNVMN